MEHSRPLRYLARVGLTIVTSHRLEALFEQLCELLAAPVTGAAPDPLATETIVVPGQGIARWLELRIADRFGITAGLEMPFLGSYLQQLTAEDGDDRDIGELFSRDVLLFRVWRLLLEQPGAFGAASAYCAGDPDGSRHLQLCDRIVQTFDGYQLYRDDLLQAFGERRDPTRLSPHVGWQAELWRALLDDAGLALASPNARSKERRGCATPSMFPEREAATSSAELSRTQARLRQRLDDDAWCRAHLPRRLTVFGPTTLPPAVLDLLRRIGRQLPVTLFSPQPTPCFIGDLRGKRARSGDNSLLLRLGVESREFQNVVLDLEEQSSEDAPVLHHALDDPPFDGDANDTITPPPAPTLLQTIQRDLVAAFDRGQQDAVKHRLAPQDRSICVHDCHGPQRELEVVRDQICRALEQDATLQPHDILVLVPDIDRYAPYAEAVFRPLQQRLPVHIADRHPARELALCRALLQVLDLATSRRTLGEVLDLLEAPAVQRRFGLFAGDTKTLRELTEQAGIRWGRDAAHRAERFELPEFEDASWQQGLDRLLLGTLTGPSDHLVLGTAPVAGVTDSRHDLLQRFLEFVDTLFTKLDELTSEAPLTQWADRIDNILAALFAPDDDDATEQTARRQLQRATSLLRRAAGTARHEQPVPLTVVQRWLDGALATGASQRGFLGGSITLAAMLPMRAVPVRHLFVCGLDDESFPRRDRAVAFDLIAVEPRPGDRNRRLDDRQLFLDLLLAARDSVHLTYAGRSAKDNATIAPSAVLSELLEHVDRVTDKVAGERASRHLVVAHPLQAWSPRYHDGGDPRLFTYSRLQLPRQQRAPSPPKPWFPRDLELETDAEAGTTDTLSPLALDELLTFWWHPCRSFLRTTLRIHLQRDDERGVVDEPFAIDPLLRYQLQDEAVDRTLRAVPELDPPFAMARARSLLPTGSLGEIAMEHVRSDTEPLLARARELQHATTRQLDFRLSLPATATTEATAVRIRGPLSGFTEAARVYLRASNIKPKDRLRAWLTHLCVTVQRAHEPDACWPAHTLLHGTDGNACYPELDADDAARWLGELVALQRAGLRRPLPYFELTTFQAASRLAQGKPDAKVLKQAASEYRSDRKSDADDVDVALCMRDRDPFVGADADEFLAIARRVWLPALEHLQESN